MALVDWAFEIGIVGTIASVCGVAYAIYEGRKRRTLEKKIQGQLWATLDRARYVIGDHVLFKEFDDQLQHPLKHRLWNIHQAASDLYISLLEQYLAGEKRFTYEDLRRLVKNELIYWPWQEKQWRLLISQRPENRDIEPPDYFVTKALNNPFRPADLLVTPAPPKGPCGTQEQP